MRRPHRPHSHETLEQRRTRAERPTMLLVRRCTIRDESVLVPLELLPGDEGGMMVVQDVRPVRHGDAARPPFDQGPHSAKGPGRVWVRPET